MDSLFFLTIVAAAIGFFIIFRKFRFHQKNKEIDFSLSPSSSVSPSSSSHNWIHEVFPSFRGEDVRRDFFSHIQKEFQRKRITPFIDNEIERGEFIGVELIRAIRGSEIAIILLSKNYASSKWCLDELVEIMKCKEELGQTVMAIFYKVDPSDVKKLTGDFGKVFRKACVGKTKEDIKIWRQALAKVATIAGYHSSGWDNEAAMIEKIAIDVSNKLRNSAPSNDFDGLVGMRAHMEKLESLLSLDSDEVRTIGISGPSGIGKSTIARYLFGEYSREFQHSVFMDYNRTLQGQKEFFSQIIAKGYMEQLDVAQDTLINKRVLVLLDDVDQLGQLDVMAKNAGCLGPGSRIIITTQDKRLLNAYGINHIYKVDFPLSEEALQMFCMHAFGQKSPYDGFKKLALEVTELVGRLPLGLRVMGSFFKGMAKHEWKKALPRLRTSLNGEIKSVLRFSYDALCDEDKDLFCYIACFFNNEQTEKVEEYLATNFVNVRQGLRVLAEKSLLSISSGHVTMHNLLIQLGREIVRKESIHEPGKALFLVDARDICRVLHNDATDSTSVIGIDSKYSEIKDELNRSDRGFEKMSNLQFLRLRGNDIISKSYLPQSLKYLPPKVRLLHWEYLPMTCLPSNFNPEFLVELNMPYNKLEKLWEGFQAIRNLERMYLKYSKNLRELPDLSTATNLKELDLSGCSSLLGLPTSIENAINLKKLDLEDCSSLVKLSSSLGNATNLEILNLRGCSNLCELPSTIGNATYLRGLYLRGCSSLLELPSSIGNVTGLKNLNLSECSSLEELPSSIENLTNLKNLYLNGCSKLEVLPVNINMESLNVLDLANCSLLKTFPEISTNIEHLKLNGTSIEEVPSSFRLWSRLERLHMSYYENLGEFPDALDRITELHLSDTRIQEIAPWIKEMSRLHKLVIKGCTKLVSLPQLPESLAILDAENSESLERLDFSFHNTKFISINFVNCFKLNQEARDLIIKTSTCRYALFPGETVPIYFTYRARGSSLSMKRNEIDVDLPTSLRFMACLSLFNKGEPEADDWKMLDVSYCIKDKQNGISVMRRSRRCHYQSPFLKEHLYAFGIEEEVSSSELVFEFQLDNKKWGIGECGLNLVPTLWSPC